MTHHPYVRRLATVLALVMATAGLAVAVSPAASAAPVPLSAEPRDDEGGTKTLTDQLDDASRGFLEAREALERSKKRQTELAAKLKEIDADLVVRQDSVSEIVNQAYRSGRLGPMTAILSATSPDSFLDRAVALDVVAVEEDRALRQLLDTKASQQQAKTAIDNEIRNQQKQVTVMAKRKSQAENALKAAQVGGDDAGGGTANGNSSKASAAKRNSDGSLPGESCSVDDPTPTGGCITPRTLHAMNQAKAAGFNRFVSCFRPNGSGEHPKGRACDFASEKNSFGGVATGASKSYGDRLANYFIDNAGALGVLYVIWFKRIWLVSSNRWKSYSGGNGDPSSDHTNHVHLSVR